VFPQKFPSGLGCLPPSSRDFETQTFKTDQPFSFFSASAIEMPGPELTWFLAGQWELSAVAHGQQVGLGSPC